MKPMSAMLASVLVSASVLGAVLVGADYERDPQSFTYEVTVAGEAAGTTELIWVDDTRWAIRILGPSSPSEADHGDATCIARIDLVQWVADGERCADRIMTAEQVQGLEPIFPIGDPASGELNWSRPADARPIQLGNLTAATSPTGGANALELSAWSTGRSAWVVARGTAFPTVYEQEEGPGRLVVATLVEQRSVTDEELQAHGLVGNPPAQASQRLDEQEQMQADPPEQVSR